MKLTTFTGPAAVLAALTLTAVPAQAQRRDQNRGGSSPNDRGQAVQRAPLNDRGRIETPRQAPPQANRQYAPAQANRQYSFDRGRAEAPRQGPALANRQYGESARAVAVPREAPRSGRAEPYRSYGYRSYDYHPSSSYNDHAYGYRPYAYTFRPRFRVGVGIYLGYPVPYPVYDPYLYPAPAYGYPAPADGYPGPDPGYPTPGTVTAAPGSAVYGGVSLEITPSNATVYVDGNYAGVVGDFPDPSRPLSLAAGRHQIRLQAPGYEPMGFDVDIVPGQVIPYRGDLSRF